MRKDLTDVTLVLDRSGSMEACRAEAEDGVSRFIEDQRKEAGECRLTLVQFDTEYEFVHRSVPIENVPPYELVPRGYTALLDAVGRAITEKGAELTAMREADRPGLVVFCIVTDGHENSSSEFNLEQIRDPAGGSLRSTPGTQPFTLNLNFGASRSSLVGIESFARTSCEGGETHFESVRTAIRTGWKPVLRRGVRSTSKFGVLGFSRFGYGGFSRSTPPNPPL